MFYYLHRTKQRFAPNDTKMDRATGCRAPLGHFHKSRAEADSSAVTTTAVSSSAFGPMVPVTSVGEPTAAPLDTEAGRQHPESFQELTEALMNG